MEVKIEQLLEAGFPLEFIYAVRVIDSLSKVNLKVDCDRTEAIKMLEKTFQDYKERLNT